MLLDWLQTCQLVAVIRNQPHLVTGRLQHVRATWCCAGTSTASSDGNLRVQIKRREEKKHVKDLR